MVDFTTMSVTINITCSILSRHLLLKNGPIFVRTSNNLETNS